MSHHPAHYTLQSHSVGEYYPWSVMIKGNFCVPFHCIDGTTGPSFKLGDGEGENFRLAYRQAEAWIRSQLSAEYRQNAVSTLRGLKNKLSGIGADIPAELSQAIDLLDPPRGEYVDGMEALSELA